MVSFLKAALVAVAAVILLGAGVLVTVGTDHVASGRVAEIR